jgi:hypothetical protein
MQIKKIYSKIFSIDKNKYIKIKRNQLLILDALLDDGSHKIYKGKNKKYFFSEHFGMLDFNKNGLVNLNQTNFIMFHKVSGSLIDKSLANLSKFVDVY